MRENHQRERNHIFNVFSHIFLSRLRTYASASAGVGKSHGCTSLVAIAPRLRSTFFLPPQETCVWSPSCCSSLSFVGDSECFGVSCAQLILFFSRPSAVRISFCLHDATIKISVGPRLSIAAGIRGGRRGAVPLVSIILILMRIVLF